MSELRSEVAINRVLLTNPALDSRAIAVRGTVFHVFREAGDHDVTILMHNDAVVQGLSEVPRMTDVEHWGVLTIGTGLGNARFTNQRR